MSQPSIEVWGILVNEPVTSLTDLLVSAVCFYAYYRLSNFNERTLVALFFRYYFLLMAVTTLWGGLIGHAFQYQFGHAWKLPGWIISMVSVSIFERMSIFHARPLIRPGLGTFFSIANITEFFIVLLVVLSTQNFFYIQVHAAFGFLVVGLSMHGFVYRHTKNETSKWVLMGIGVTTIASWVYTTQFSIDIWFNYLDLSHVLMALAAYLHFIGASRLQPAKL